MTKKMGVKGGCVGGDGDRSVVKRGVSSTISRYLTGKNIDGKFFGKRQLKLSNSSLLLLESPSCMETSGLISIRTVSDASSSAQSLNMLLFRYMRTLNIGGGRKKSPAWAFYKGCINSACNEDSVWYHFTIFHTEEPQHLSERIKGVVLYTRLNNSSVSNHVMSAHPRDNKYATMFYDGNVRT